MKEPIKELLFRIRKVRGVYLTLFWGIFALLFLFADLIVIEISKMNPTFKAEFDQITIALMGQDMPLLSVFRILFYFCIFLVIVSWFDGLICELARLIVAIYLAIVVMIPFSTIMITVDYTTYAFTINLFLSVFFWLYILVRIITILLELYRFKIDLDLNKKYVIKEAQGPSEIILFRNTRTNRIVKKIFKEPKEYSWFDSEFKKPKLESDDKFVISEWKPQRTKYVTLNREKSRRLLVLYIYISIYALIVFIIEDGMAFPMDATMRVLTFPLMLYFIFCFRDVGKLFKSVLLMLFFMLLAFNLLEVGVITANGIFYLYYLKFLLNGITIITLLIVNPPEFINGIINDFVYPYDSLSMASIRELTGYIFEYYYTVAGILCVFIQIAIWFFYNRRKESAVILSNNHIFIRDKTRTSKINDLKIGLSLLLAPANRNKHRNALRKMQYDRLAAIDGGGYDYGKIPFHTLLKVKKTKALPVYYNVIMAGYIILMVLVVISNIIIGVDILLNVSSNITLLILGIAAFYYVRKKKLLFDIQLTFDRSKVRGPWIYGHTYTSIKFKDVTGDFADNLLQHCDPSIIYGSWIFEKKKQFQNFRSRILEIKKDKNAL